MTTIDITSTAVCSPDPGDPLAEAHLAAAAFLARYQGRTLDAYRHDLRVFFQWALEVNLDVLVATRPQIELYVRALEERGLAPTGPSRRTEHPPSAPPQRWLAQACHREAVSNFARNRSTGLTVCLSGSPCGTGLEEHGPGDRGRSQQL